MQEITDGSRIENPSLRFQIKKKNRTILIRFKNKGGKTRSPISQVESHITHEH